MLLQSDGSDSYVIDGGLCGGTRIRVMRRPAFGRSGSDGAAREPEGFRHAAHGKASVTDLEAGQEIVAMIDSPGPVSHHHGEDARDALEQYFATEAVVRSIERSNYPPMLSHHDLTTIRTVRPEFPEPPRRVSLMPSGVWTRDYEDVWKVGPSLFHGRASGAAMRMALLEFALNRLGEEHEALGWFTADDRRHLDRFEWYRDMTEVSNIAVKGAARKLAQERGVHVVKQLVLEVSTRTTDRVPRRIRKVPAPMWLEDEYTLVLTQGFEPTVEDVASLIKAGRSQSLSPSDCMRIATGLLGQSGEREQHAELERQFTEELTRRVGSELEVTVSIRPRARPAETLS